MVNLSKPELAIGFSDAVVCDANDSVNSSPLCIGIAGPTASGKSAASMLIAEYHDVEIISVDSALVFRGMDIGTAKPSAAELAAVPHHLINILDPLHSFSAAQFVSEATRLIMEIRARGKLPLLVGGTMLYFKALIDGLDDMPAANPIVRAQIDLEAEAQGWPAMHAQLALVDPLTAARLNINDAQRIQRALEVFRSSGRALSSFHGIKRPEDQSEYAQTATQLIANSKSPFSHMPLISLEPTDRSWLHARIALRLQAMLADGLVDEVRTLRARGDLHSDMTSMRCVGYRQTWEYLDKHEQSNTQNTEKYLLDLCIFATRQLAKRQLTWLRSMPQRRIVACDQPEAAQTVLQQVHTLLAG